MSRLATRVAWRKADTFRPGETGARQYQLGPDPGDGQSCPILYGNLRVGFLNTQPVENFAAEVVICDDGTTVGPLDLPFELCCELPVLVKVRPESVVSAAVEVVATVSTPPIAYRWQATRAVFLPQNTPVAIPQWATSVTVLANAIAVDLLDVAATTLVTITGPVTDAPRPRNAVAMQTASANGVWVLLSYQA